MKNGWYVKCEVTGDEFAYGYFTKWQMATEDTPGFDSEERLKSYVKEHGNPFGVTQATYIKYTPESPEIADYVALSRNGIRIARGDMVMYFQEVYTVTSIENYGLQELHVYVDDIDNYIYPEDLIVINDDILKMLDKLKYERRINK